MLVLCVDLFFIRYFKDLLFLEEEEEEEEDVQLQSEVEDMYEEMEEDDLKISFKRLRFVGNKKRKNLIFVSEEKLLKVVKCFYYKKQYCYSVWL